MNFGIIILHLAILLESSLFYQKQLNQKFILCMKLFMFFCNEFGPEMLVTELLKLLSHSCFIKCQFSVSYLDRCMDLLKLIPKLIQLILLSYSAADSWYFAFLLNRHLGSIHMTTCEWSLVENLRYIWCKKVHEHCCYSCVLLSICFSGVGSVIGNKG